MWSQWEGGRLLIRILLSKEWIWFIKGADELSSIWREIRPRGTRFRYCLFETEVSCEGYRQREVRKFGE